MIRKDLVNTKRLRGAEEPIPGLNGVTFGEFWSWAYSDVLSNTIRPLFAEYLVGRSLGLIDRPRVEWNHVDFVYWGKKIEVKSSAYVQTWAQKRPSRIEFDIASKERPWIAETNTFGTAGRPADCYVFCVQTDRDVSTCEVCDPNRWVFYVVLGETITKIFGEQKCVRLSRIAAICAPVRYDELKCSVDMALRVTRTVIQTAQQ